jgi:hypothetical protein
MVMALVMGMRTTITGTITHQHNWRRTICILSTAIFTHVTTPATAAANVLTPHVMADKIMPTHHQAVVTEVAPAMIDEIVNGLGLGCIFACVVFWVSFFVGSVVPMGTTVQ